jgi:amino acid adenylation domain-containing protein
MRLSEFVIPRELKVAADPSMAIAALPLLEGPEQTALAEFNATARDYPGDRGIAAVFGEQVAAQPDARALSWWDGELDYAGLEAQANRLAHHLRAQIEALAGASAGQPVIAVYLERSPELVVALLAVLKAGAAYLPLDAQEPAERLGFMLSDAGAVLVVSTRELSDRLPAGHPAVVLLDEEAAAIAARPAIAPPCAANGESLAYVMYTSGSTGQPKGVCIAQRAVLRLAFADYVQVGRGDCIAQAANAAFDALTFEIWGALLNGAAVHVLRREEVLDPARFTEQLRAGRFNTLFLTTTLFNRFVQLDPAMFAGLNTLVVGGEAVDSAPAAAVLAHGRPRHLLNGYGPTECTTFATSYEVETIEPGTAPIPIGRPLSNTTAHVLDHLGAPVPIGVAGELHIGGDGLATGYLNRPELTAERFIAHPQFGRLYRTGDRCRRLADGNLVFLGRLDQQIKLRGFRIEPGEIEACLTRVQELRQAVVVLRTNAAGEACLVAYYTAAIEIPAAVLRKHARDSLPHYMVPAVFTQLEALPLTRNGKVDRAALPNPDEHARGLARSAPERPLNPTETTLCAIWRETMGCSDVGPNDNFFDLGGHSLMAVRIIHLIQVNFGVLLPFTIIYAAPTVVALAEKVLDVAKFGDRRLDQPLVTLNGGAIDRSIFAFPPGTADALGYAALAGRLVGHRFHAFNFIEAKTRLDDYVDLICRTASDRPCVLFGYSGGGNFAFRTARELERRGKRVEAVVLLDASRFVKSFDFPAEEARRLALEFVGAEGVQPYLKNPALKDKVIRTIERYHVALSQSPDDGVIDAPIHLILSEGSPDEFRDANGSLVCSKSAWAVATRGPLHTCQGSGDHDHMLHLPHLDANAALLAGIFASIFPDDRARGADQ